MKGYKLLTLTILLIAGVILSGCGSSAKHRQKETQPSPTAEVVATQPDGSQAQSGEAGPTVVPTQAQQRSSGFTSDELKSPEESKEYRTFHAHTVEYISLPKSNRRIAMFDIQTYGALDAQGRRSLHIVVSEPGANVHMEIVKIGDQSWVSDDGKNWVMKTADLTSLPITPASHFTSLYPGMDNHWVADGSQKIDGISTTRWVLKSSGFEMLGTMLKETVIKIFAPDLKLTSFQVESARAEMFVDPNGVVIKGKDSISGTARNDGETFPLEIVYEYNVDHINDPSIKVEPPAPASNLAKAPFPMPPDAKLQMSSGGTQIFTAPKSTVADVMDFFEKNLPKAGFQISDKQGGNDEGWTFRVTGKNGTYFVMVMPTEPGVEIDIQR